MESFNPLGKVGRELTVHHHLAHSYFLHLVLFLVGVSMDLYFHLDILADSIGTPLGLVLMILGSLLVFWAQKTGRNLHKGNLTRESFYKGPYRFTRVPTQLGLFLTVSGFAIIANAFFVFAFSVISFLFAKLTFLKKAEDTLERKYGEPYREYKKSVRL